MADKTSAADNRINNPLQREQFLALLADIHCRRILESHDAQRLYEALDCELFISSGSTSLSMLVTSATGGEGRSTIAALLAGFRAFCDPACRVVLIDGHLGTSGITSFFNPTVTQGMGLAEYFSNPDITFDQCIRKTTLHNFDLITCGQPFDSQRFSHNRFSHMINEAIQRYQLVIVDGPAAGSCPDAIAMAKTIGSVLTVVRFGGPNREQLQRITHQILSTGARIAGAILNQRIYPVPHLLYRLA